MKGLSFLSRGVRQELLSAVGDPLLRDNLARTLVQYKDVKLTAAQMDALNATPIEVLPAPGAGLTNILVGSFCFVDAGSTPFELGTGTLDIRYTDGSGALAAQHTNALIESAADAVGWSAPQAHVVAVENAKLVARASADVTAGNGVVYLRLFYLTVKASELGLGL